MTVEGGVPPKRAAVVIPVKNECRELNRLLTALSRQLGESDEVICVDAGSTDGTWETLCRFAETHPQFKAFREDGAYPGRARNIAIQRTSARFIVHIDGGNMPHEQWLATILDPLLHGRADYVMGDVAVNPVTETLWGLRMDAGRFYGASLFRGLHIRGRMLHPPAGGAAVAYRREVWEKAGGIPEWLRTGEDRLYAKKLMQQDLRIAFAEKAVVYWEIGPTLWDFLKRRYNYQRIRVDRMDENAGGRKGISLYFVFLGAAAAALFYRDLWPIPVAILIASVCYQTVKSARTYFQRSLQPEGCPLWIFTQFLALEALVFPAKLLGTIRGLFRDVDQHRYLHDQTEKYLTS